MTNSFDIELLSCVDKVLLSLGPNVKTVIIFYLEKKGVKFKEIPKKPDRFSELLREIYGGGAIIIEKMVIKCLASKKEIEVPEEDFVSSLKKIKMKWKP